MKKWFVLALATALGSAALVSSPARAANGEDTRVIVHFKKGVSQADKDQTVKDHHAKKDEEIYADSDSWVVESQQGKKSTQTAADFRKDKKVQYAEPDVPLHIMLSNPNDSLFSQEYAHQRINSVAGWSLYPGSYTPTGGPTVAMIDTGIQADHPDLTGHIDTANSNCFGLTCLLTGYADDNGHGTHTSGTVGAATNNGTGVAGVAFNTKLMALKVCNAAGVCMTSDIVSALNWARTHGAKVASMSLGGGGSTTMQTAVVNAYNAGLVLVAAAGNDGNSNVNYPAGYAEVISVAATDSGDAHASFSNTNSDVEVSAPGVNVLSTYTSSSYQTLSGTSMSTPHVAGLAALLFGEHPTWTNVMVRNQIDQCSDDLGAPGRDTTFGFGRINLGRALGTC